MSKRKQIMKHSTKQRNTTLQEWCIGTEVKNTTKIQHFHRINTITQDRLCNGPKLKKQNKNTTTKNQTHTTKQNKTTDSRNEGIKSV